MIVNLTQHTRSSEQLRAGVIDLTPELAEQAAAFLTFDALPDVAEIERRAAALAGVAVEQARLVYAPDPVGFDVSMHDVSAMIGGAPYLMPALERALILEGITPVYAFSVRQSMEEAQADGSVRKVNIFRHIGFVTGGTV